MTPIPHTPDPAPPRPASVGRARVLRQALASALLWGLVAACGLAAAFSVLAFLAERLWIADLVVHFRLQYLALGLLAAAVFVWQRRRWAAALGVLVAVLNAGPAWGYLSTATPALGVAHAAERPAAPSASAQPESARPESMPPLRVAAFNVFFANRNHEGVVRWLQAQDADVVVLVEISERWQRALESRIPAELAHRRLERRPGRSGTLILSRWPLADPVRVDVDPQRTPEVLVTVQRPGAPFRLAAVHATWPLGESLSELRNRELERLAELARSSPLPFVAAGDFNITPFSPHFVALLERGQLRSAASGWQPTWPSLVPLLGIQIDHLLVSSQVDVQDFRRIHVPGSDHLAVAATLRI